jgi:phospholipid-binding lipoprotein MlaA
MAAMSLTRAHNFLMILAVLLVSSACATRPHADNYEAVQEYERNNDPLEPMNRVIFQANVIGDKIILRPLVKGYNAVVPDPARQGVTNFLANLWEPWTAINQLLQGKPDDAAGAVGRFLVNSTVGIGGLVDVATDWGLERTEEDFGQTLGVWGMGEGPYIVLPFFGPSNPRDTLGLAGDFYGDPVGWAINSADVGKNFFLGVGLLSYIHFGADAFDKRARYDSVFDDLYDSPDPYALARSAFRQKRDFEISDGETDTSEEDDLFDEFDDPENEEID